MPEKFDKELQSIDPVRERQEFIDALVSRLEDVDMDIKNDVVQAIFAHSVNDAFVISDRLGIPRENQFIDFIYSARGNHIVTWEDVINGDTDDREDPIISSVYFDLLNKQKYLSQESRDFIDETVTYFNSSSNGMTNSLVNKLRIGGSNLPKEIYDLIQEYYLPFVAQKRFKELSPDSVQSTGERLALEVFSTREYVTSKHYPFAVIYDYIKEKTGKEIEREGLDSMPEWEVKKKFERYGLDYDEAVASGAIYTKAPLKEVYEIKRDTAIRELKNEIRDNLIRLGHDGDSFEIVEGDDGFKVVEKRGDGDKDAVQEVDEGKIFDKDGFVEKVVDVNMYKRVDFVDDFNGKLVFKGQYPNGECVINLDGVESKRVKEILNIVISKNNIWYETYNDVGEPYVTDYNQSLASKSYYIINRLSVVDDKLVFAAKKDNGMMISFVDGVESGEYDFVEPVNDVNGKAYIPVKIAKDYFWILNGKVVSGTYQSLGTIIEIGGKKAFSARKRDGLYYVIYNNQEIGPYKNIRSLMETDGKLIFTAQKSDDKWYINYDGQEIGPYENLHLSMVINGELVITYSGSDGLDYVIYNNQNFGPYQSVNSFTEIDDKLFFTALKSDNKWYINYDGQEAGPYRFIESAKQIDKRLAFIALIDFPGLNSNVYTVVHDGKISNPYFRIMYLIDLQDKPAFVGERDGKWHINYNNQEIPGFEFDDVQIFKYDKETGLLLISGFINGKLVTYTKYLKPQKTELELSKKEKEKIELLNLLKNPNPEAEEEQLSEHLKSVDQKLSRSHNFADRLNTIIGEDPAMFFDDVRAKSEKLPYWRIEQIVDKFFPEIKINKEKEKRQKRSGSFLGNLFNSLNEKENDSSDYESMFDDRDNMELIDGDPKEKGFDMGIEFRTNVRGMLATNINISNSNSSRWERLEFPITEELSGPAEEVTATISVNGKTSLLLPRFTDSRIISSRIKVLDKNGKDIPFTVNKNQLGQVRIESSKPMDKVLFSQEKPLITPAPEDISSEEYSIFRKQFESRYGETVIDSILDLPPELIQFTNSIEHLSPVDKIIAIEEYVKKISYYDFDNREVQGLKRGKNNDERLAIMQLRLDDLSTKGVNTEGKMFAGVCADFALITTALLRKAGIISGVITGLNMNGKKATSSQSHGLSFVVWPSSDGKNEIHIIDGTPGANNSYMSLIERFEERDKNIDVLMKDSDIKLKRMQDIIDGLDIEAIKSLSNGELEEALNVILRYGVKRRNLHVIESILNTKYAPINISEIDLDDMSNVVKVTKMVSDQISLERKKNRKIVDIDIDSGKKLFDTISEFIERFADRDGANKEQAINRIERIFKISEQFLDPIESKAVFATINYLKAKRMVKSGK